MHELTLAVDGGVTLHGWWATPEAAATDTAILYLGGNGEEISGRLVGLARYTGWQVVGLNYRGYGLSGGKPSEAALFADALALYDLLAARGVSRIVLCGRSIGTGVAVYLARQRCAAGIILVTPYDSMVSLATEHYCYPLAHQLLCHRFDSLSRVPAIRLPLLALLSQHDVIIPHRHAYRLLNAWGGPVAVHTIPHTGHSSIGAQEEFYALVRGYLAEVA